MEHENHLGTPQPDKAPQTCENVSPAFPAKKVDAGREAAGALVHTVDTMPPRPRGDLSPRLPAAGSDARPLDYCGPWTHWDLSPDTVGFEPRAFRMRSGCDATTPCAPEQRRASDAI